MSPTALLLCLSLLLPGCASAGASPAPDAVAVAAQAGVVFSSAQAAYLMGTGDLDAVYRWSVRWQEAQAEQDPTAAARAHLTRMQSLEAVVQERTAQGLAGRPDLEAAC